MAPKKGKVQEKNTTNKITTNEDKYILLRDLPSKMLLILNYNNISTSKTSKIKIGSEVTYVTKDRIHGRGLILLIGTDEECAELLVVLEKNNTSKISEDSHSNLVIDEHPDLSEEEDDNTKESSNDNQQDNIGKKNQVKSDSDNSKHDIPNKQSPKNNKRPPPLANKSLNENDENVHSAKRLKKDNNVDSTYLRGRITALQTENKELKDKIEMMETNWMPRPDPVTITYFSKIVSLCAGENNGDQDSKGDKLENIMTTLVLNESELDSCTDKKSIRSTCRKLVRLLFKNDLSNPNVHFGAILKKKENKNTFEAIREYGRLVHPIESLRFTDGELNNAMGSDFYQRDRNLKQQKNEPVENSGENINPDDDDDDEDDDEGGD